MCRRTSTMCSHAGGVDQEVVGPAVAREPRRQVDQQHERQPLRRERVEGDRDVRAHLIELRAATPGREDPRGDPDHDRDRRCRAPPSGSCWRVPPAGCPTRAAGSLKETPMLPCAQLPAGRSGTAPRAACPGRTAPRATRRSSGVASRDPGEVADRVPGKHAEQEEVDRDRDEHGDDRERRALDQVVGAPHRRFPSATVGSPTPGAPTSSSASRSC